MNYTKYLYILLIGGAICSPFSVSGQKKKQKIEVVLNEQDSSRLDALFIDATNDYLAENYRVAIKKYEKTKDGYPLDGAIYHQIAKSYDGLKLTEKAIQYEEIAIELSPVNKFYYLFLAELYREVKAWNEMATCYEAMLVNTTGGEEFYYDLGHLYAFFFQVAKRQYVYAKDVPDNNYLTQKIPKKERKRMDELVVQSIMAYDSYQEIFGISEEFIKDKQEILLEAGQLEKAIEEGHYLIEKFPNRVEYILTNAALYSSIGYYQKAVDYLINQREVTPDYRLTLALIANYEKLEEIEKVNASISLLMSSTDAPLEEKTTILVNLIKTTSKKSSMDFIYGLTQELVISNPENIDIKFLLGDVYFFRGELVAARESYLVGLTFDVQNKYAWQQVLGIDLKLDNNQLLKEDGLAAVAVYAKEGVFYYWLSLAYTHDNEFEEAIDALLNAKEGTQKSELLTQVFAELGGNYYRIKDYVKSDQAYDQALVYSPNNGFVLNNYSYYLSLRKEHLNKAKSMAKRLIMLYPNEPAYLDTYGWVLYQMKEYKEASLYLEKASSQTESPAIFEHYGDVLYKLNKQDEAVVWWKKAQSFGSSSVVLKNKISDKKLYEQ